MVVKQVTYNSAASKTAVMDIVAMTEDDGIVLFRPINRFYGSRGTDCIGYQVFLIGHDSMGALSMRNISVTVALAASQPYMEGDEHFAHVYLGSSALHVWGSIVHRAEKAVSFARGGYTEEFAAHMLGLFRELEAL